MIVNFEIEEMPDHEFVLTGTMTPRGVPLGTPVSFAQLEFSLTRDVTISDTYSVPIVSKDMRMPLRFKHHFTPSGGFDGVMFNWDVHYAK
ncbi:hypothetical protein [Pseudodesulfovibrio sp. zrk46]|uniref:hypothetical protein n=1 Tax=Pseudodesulfovibrio sp. zrk46 TaxID=2725288 RepID=UPI001448D319|nr:hypothetical protein [Pseudodesulfovibrio sp. zrk46]QJB56998.1 hypothetical protein HFN16_11560 [Pseudodesulfovibrio sp. zrk46]